jgi:fatty acid desaturase
MAATQDPPARRPFRFLAIVVAFVCFLLSGASQFILGEDWLVGAIIFLFVGLMMCVIAITGYWPRRRR